MSWKIVKEIQEELKRMYDQRLHHRPYDKGYWKGRMEALSWQWNQNMKELIHAEPFKKMEVKCGMIFCDYHDKIDLCKRDSIAIRPMHAKKTENDKGFCAYYSYHGLGETPNR